MTDPAASPVDALPCPFCGGDPQSRAFGNTWYVECSQCGATTRGTTAVETSTEAWNRRVQACESCGDLLDPSSLIDAGICDFCHSRDSEKLAETDAKETFVPGVRLPPPILRRHLTTEFRDATPEERAFFEGIVGHPVETLRIPVGGISMISEDGVKATNPRTLRINNEPGGHVTVWEDP